jgi:hypothetical protein
LKNNFLIYLKTASIIAACTIILFSLSADIYAGDSVIIINEIAWMGTKNSYNDEWIELFNPNDFPVNLDNWILSSKDETLYIKLFGIINPKSYFLLERTDDSSVPNIAADLIYKGGLNNQGENLILSNEKKDKIDEIDCSLGWFSGNNENKKTMERINFSSNGSDQKNWKTSQITEGTPKTLNSSVSNVYQKTRLETSNKNYGVSNLPPLFLFGFFSSACIAGIFSVIWLKIKKKSSNINY